MKISNLIKVLACVALFTPVIYSCSNNSSESKNEEKETEAVAEGVIDKAERGTVVFTGDPYECPQFKVVDGIIISENLPVVVDFYTDWCSWCKKYSPIFDGVATQYYDQAVFVSINAETYPEITKAYGVEGFPTTAFIMTGGATLGVQPGYIEEEQLITYINQLVNTNAGANMSL